MKIALIGYGKMGKMIEKVALQRGHTIVCCINSSHWDDQAIAEADICIEFSRPESAVANIQKIASAKKPIIIGTTGWYDQLPQVREIVQQSEIGAIYTSNFSIGVQLFFAIVQQAARLINAHTEYDVAGVEMHHRNKKDAPSGTALMVSKIIEENIDRVEKMDFAALRCGAIPGTHTVVFDGPCDSITITHEAKNREGFALGAVQAAEMLQNKKGLYRWEQLLR